MTVRSWFRRRVDVWTDRRRGRDERAVDRRPADRTRWDADTARVERSIPADGYDDRIAR